MTTEMSAAEYRALRQRERSKYGNRRVQDGDEWYDSEMERRRHKELLLLQEEGVIACLRRQVHYPIKVNGEIICTYIADFVYDDLERDCEVVEDVKGYRTREYVLKRKLMLVTRGIEILETTA